MSSQEIQEIKEEMKKLEQRISYLERLLTENNKPHLKPISMREFFLSKNSQNDVHKTLIIGFYLENYENMSSFNVKDLETGFRKIKEKIPMNINDKVNMNIKNGHMDEAKEKKDNRKVWYWTNSGEEFVKNEL